MPLIKQWSIDEQGIAAIWKVEEQEIYFAENTGLSSPIKNDTRRLEYLAGRFLLKHLLPSFPLHEIYVDEHGKPRLPNDSFHFSVSHSLPYIAVALHPMRQTGIDIQTWKQKIAEIQHKFLSPTEQKIVGSDPKMLMLAWCAKESVYKWHGKKGIEFIEELPILEFYKDENININIYFKLNEKPKIICLESIINIDFACSYVSKVENLSNNIKIIK